MGETVSAVQQSKSAEDMSVEERVSALEEKERKRHIRETQESEAKFVEANFRGGVAYTNVVIAAGYAGGFWIWTNTRQYLDVQHDALVAVLYLFSLSVFVFWNVCQMISVQLTVLAWSRVLDPSIVDYDAFKAAYRDRDLRLARLNLVLARGWLAMLALTVIPALIAITVLFPAFLKYIFL